MGSDPMEGPHGRPENGKIFSLDMSGEMHMWRRDEVFGCIPHGRGALI